VAEGEAPNGLAQQNREDIIKLQSGKADVAAMSNLQTDMRNYVDKANEAQSSNVETLVTLSVNGAKSDVMQDVNNLMRDGLDRWATEKLEPIVDRIIHERDKLHQEQRKADLQKYRTWVILATSSLLFLGTLWNTFNNNNKSARDVNSYNRAVERLNDIVRP